MYRSFLSPSSLSQLFGLVKFIQVKDKYYDAQKSFYFHKFTLFSEFIYLKIIRQNFIHNWHGVLNNQMIMIILFIKCVSAMKFKAFGVVNFN